MRDIGCPPEGNFRGGRRSLRRGRRGNRKARAAAGRPAHLEATGIAHAMYERYALEFYRVRKRHGSPSFEFEPYDRPHREAA